MSNFPLTVKVRSAVGKKYKHHLPSVHITTNDFFKQKPVYVHEMVPGERLSMNMQTFSRADVLQKPFYGNVTVVNRAFFVPCRTIMEGWNALIERTNYVNASGVQQVNKVPIVTNNILSNCFTIDSAWATVSGQSQEPDFKAGPNKTPYNFTITGRYAYDILLSLGYNINFYAEDYSELSALPLLAYAKIFIDWYKNTNYSTSVDLEKFFTGVDRTLTPMEIREILQAVFRVQFERDYFTSAFQRSFVPSSGNTSEIKLTDVYNPDDEYKGSVWSNNNGQIPPFVANDSNKNEFTFRFTQYLDSALHRLTDYLKRHQLAGSRFFDRYLAEWGISLDSAVTNRSIYIGKQTAVLNIADVTNTGESLGAFGGKGYGYKDSKFTYETKEFGFFIVVSTFVPEVAYCDGRPRYLQHLRNLDFAHGDFDGLGVQPIRQDEVFANSFIEGNSPSDYVPENIFGFTSRYAEYKTSTGNSRLTGDFALRSKSRGLNAFELFRHTNNMQSQAVAGLNFASANLNNSRQFNRIFNYTGQDYDHFFTRYSFDVVVHNFLKPMYEDYDWCSDGREIEANLNGTMLT